MMTVVVDHACYSSRQVKMETMVLVLFGSGRNRMIVCVQKTQGQY